MTSGLQVLFDLESESPRRDDREPDADEPPMGDALGTHEILADPGLRVLFPSFSISAPEVGLVLADPLPPPTCVVFPDGIPKVILLKRSTSASALAYVGLAPDPPKELPRTPTIPGEAPRRRSVAISCGLLTLEGDFIFVASDSTIPVSSRSKGNWELAPSTRDSIQDDVV